MTATPIADLVAKMLSDGVNHDVIVMAVRAIENGQKISPAALRMRKFRERKRNAVTPRVTPPLQVTPRVTPGSKLGLKNNDLGRNAVTSEKSSATIYTSSNKKDSYSERGSGGKQKIQFPSQFVLGAQQLEFAIANGWGRDKANSEFARFKDYHLSKGSKFASWPAAWRTWVRNGVQFAERDAAKKSTREDLYTTALF